MGNSLQKQQLTQAGIPKVLFLSQLAKYDISTFKLTEAELIEDLVRA
ncbi:hypothetical protein [Nostoc sp.]